MLKIFKKSNEKRGVIYSPIKGMIRDLQNIEDETFRTQTLGRTIAIDPMENIICSPVNGKIIGLFPTCHSISIRSDFGYDILLHIGLNTHLLNGTGFIIHIHKGDHVTAGQRILEFDREMMMDHHYDPVILLIITNASKFGMIDTMKTKHVEIMDELISLKYQQ